MDNDPQWREAVANAKATSDFYEEVMIVMEAHGKTYDDLRNFIDLYGGDYEYHSKYTGAPCKDCGVKTVEIGEYYNVYNDVWNEADGGQGFLCIGCLENRLGRKLNPDDFGHCLITTDPLYFRSARYFNRLGWGEYA